MSRIFQPLAQGQLAGSAAALVTVAAGYDYCITNIMLHNTHSSALTVYLYHVPDSAGSPGTAGATNIFYQQSIAAYDTVLWGREDLGIWMIDTGDTLQGYCGTASKVNYFIYGLKQTDQT